MAWKGHIWISRFLEIILILKYGEYEPPYELAGFRGVVMSCQPHGMKGSKLRAIVLVPGDGL